MDGSATRFPDGLSFSPAFPGQDAAGILYFEDFDAEPPAPPVPVQPPAPPAFTEEDLAAARREGHATGLQAALSDAALVQSQLQAAATQAVSDALTGARAGLDRIATEQAEQTARLVLAVLQAALPAVMQKHAMVEAEAMLRALAPGLAFEADLRVRTHPQMADGVRDMLAALWPRDGGVLCVAADPSLAPGDVQLAWENGGAERNCAAIWDAIRQALAVLDLPPLEEVCCGHGH
jgi:flagellar assembly protein FliH